MTTGLDPPERLLDIVDWNESGQLWVTVLPTSGALTVRVCGDLDLFTAESLRQQVCSSLAFHGSRIVEVDLADCTFIDSAGIHVLLQLARALAQRHGRLEITAASANVRRVMDATVGAARFTRPLAEAEAAT